MEEAPLTYYSCKQNLKGGKMCSALPLIGFRYEMIKSLIFTSTAVWLLLPCLGLGSVEGMIL